MNDNPINNEILNDLRGLESGDSTLITELFTIFLADADKQQREIIAAVHAASPTRLRAAAHALKGGAGSLGADSLSGLCRKLEELGRAGSTDGAEAMLRALGMEIDSVRVWFAAGAASVNTCKG